MRGYLAIDQAGVGRRHRGGLPAQRLAAVSLWPDPSALRAELQNNSLRCRTLLEPLFTRTNCSDELLPLSKLLEPRRRAAGRAPTAVVVVTTVSRAARRCDAPPGRGVAHRAGRVPAWSTSGL